MNIANAFSCAPGPVGSFPLDMSPYGVEGMAGNVREWVFDGWDYRSYETCTTPCADPVVDPTTSEAGVVRGGTYTQYNWIAGIHTTFVRQAERFDAYPSGHLGFRCARDAD